MRRLKWLWIAFDLTTFYYTGPIALDMAVHPLQTALIVAHPGHELRLHGWLQTRLPKVFVLTDGSGHSNTSRLDSTRRVLERTGCRTGGVFGRMTDREVYQAILHKDPAPFVSIIDEISEELMLQDISEVVGDAAEFYNPTHDLCRFLINLVVDRLAVCGNPAIRNYQFSPIESHDCAWPHRSGGRSIHLRLDDPALDRKLDDALAYQELSGEVSSELAERGREGFRIECMTSVASPSSFVKPHHRPFYENYGAQQARAGYYTDVLRYRDHFLPLTENLARQVRKAT